MKWFNSSIEMSCRDCNSVRPYVGALALVIGSWGILASVLTLPLSLSGHTFWTGFSPDGPGMAPAEREAAVSARLRSDLLYRFTPLFFGSVTLVAYGFYEAQKEKRKSRAITCNQNGPGF
jgi:hypothetical protein